eukprot:CAMPEP_0194723920 /NCGR_PEP_ID=MMETSP0296-20130528/15627_1 /TAXON_ID=39354 /ORGANISM="Heterosigma akashiwo, Strain CCMP2393" /LENGTH=57 /DNA_ID=CAMNT_0039627567 /DNA_START=39 /DNA_END=209 /DNA_ORIENTATION=+
MTPVKTVLKRKVSEELSCSLFSVQSFLTATRLRLKECLGSALLFDFLSFLGLSLRSG